MTTLPLPPLPPGATTYGCGHAGCKNTREKGGWYAIRHKPGGYSYLCPLHADRVATAEGAEVVRLVPKEG